MSDWSATNILPLNSDFGVTGRFGYDYNNNTFYSFGGYVPAPVYGQSNQWEDTLRRFRVGDADWSSIVQTGDKPPTGMSMISYYDAQNNRFNCSNDGIWALKLTDIPTQFTYQWSTGETTASISPSPSNHNVLCNGK